MNHEIKQAVVLCAGEGTRLRPLSFSRPKHMLPVGGRPLLGWALDTLAQAGIEEVGLVTGHRPEAIERYVGDGSSFGMRATYLTQPKPLGLGHAVMCAREFLGGDSFLLYLGDNLLENGVAPLLEEFARQRPAACLYVKSVEDPRAYGVVVLENGRVTRLVEKPADPPSHLAIVGAYAFTPAILEAIAVTPPSARGEYEITDAIQTLVNQGEVVVAREAEGFWEDAGRPAELLKANRLYLDRQAPGLHGQLDAATTIEGPVYVAAGTRVRRCKLVGPCLIQENCILEDAEVGPYVSLGSGSRVIGSRIADCIVQADCRIEHLRGGLSDSVLGTAVEVTGPANGETPPLHLLLGDMAAIQAR